MKKIPRDSVIRWTLRSLIFLGGWSIISLLVTFGPFLFKGHLIAGSKSISDWASLGGFLSGTIGTLVSGIAMVYVYKTYHEQKESNIIQEEESNVRRAIELSNQIHNLYKMEKSLFDNVHEKLVRATTERIALFQIGKYIRRNNDLSIISPDIQDDFVKAVSNLEDGKFNEDFYDFGFEVFSKSRSPSYWSRRILHELRVIWANESYSFESFILEFNRIALQDDDCVKQLSMIVNRVFLTNAPYYYRLSSTLQATSTLVSSNPTAKRIIVASLSPEIWFTILLYSWIKEDKSISKFFGDLYYETNFEKTWMEAYNLREVLGLKPS